MAFGMAKVSANPSPLAVRYFDRVGGHGVLGWCSDGMPANLAVTSFGLFLLGFWGKVHRIGRGAGVGTWKLVRKGTACLLPRLIEPDC